MFKSVYNGNMTKQKYAVAYFLCFALVLVNILSAISGLFTISSNNMQVDAADLWSTYTQTATKDNDGYCIINSPEKFSWFFYKSKGTKAKLICDIDMSAHTWDSPIISRDLEMNGSGCIVSGLKLSLGHAYEESITFKKGKLLTITVTNFVVCSGLISYSEEGNINFSNLILQIDSIGLLPPLKNTTEVNYYVRKFGGFVGYKKAGNLNISNCSVYGDFKIKTAGKKENGTFGYTMGTFVGSANNIVAKNCFSYASMNLQRLAYKLTIGTFDGTSYVGGIIGSVDTSCNFELCGNYGDITADTTNLGGLIGYAVGLNMNNARCFNSGNITNSYNNSTAKAGGLIGYVKSVKNSTISYVYNTANVSSKGVAGGIVGDSGTNLSFSNVYNSGDVVATKNISGSSNKTGSQSLNVSGQSRFLLKEQDRDNNYKIHVEDYTTDYIYTDARDISIIGDDSKINTKSKVYSIKPSCYAETSNIGLVDYKLNFDVGIHNQDDELVSSATASTEYFSQLQSIENTVLAWYDEKYYEGADTMYDKVYYTDAICDSSLPEIDNEQTVYNDIEREYEKIYLKIYLLEANAYYLYSILEEKQYKDNGLPKYKDVVSYLNKNITIYDIYLVGARIYLCHFNEKYSPDEDDYFIYIFPLFECKTNWWVIDHGISHLYLPAVQGAYHRADFNLVQTKPYNINSNSSYQTIDQIKSASFSGQYFATNSQINDGLPVFKEMYWELG